MRDARPTDIYITHPSDDHPDHCAAAAFVTLAFRQLKEEDLVRLGELLEPLHRDTSPFDTEVPAQHARDARWVEPRLVGEVSFAEWTTDGILRQPSWRGLRIDKDASEVHRED